MLHTTPIDYTTESSTAALVEPVEENENIEDNQLSLLDNFQDFIQKCVEDQIHLGRDMNFEELHLPNWCRVHNASHSELECCMFQIAVEQVQKCFNPTSTIKINIQSIQDDPKGKKVMISEEPSSSNSTRDTTKKSRVVGYWILRFDGSKSKQGVGAGFELIIPKGKTYFFSHRLQFHCTNNVAEYEALVHGLLVALRKKG